MKDDDDKLTFFYSGNPNIEVYKLIAPKLEKEEHYIVGINDIKDMVKLD